MRAAVVGQIGLLQVACRHPPSQVALEAGGSRRGRYRDGVVTVSFVGTSPARSEEAADLVVVAPATANTIAKLAHGLADDLVSTLCLATEAPLLLAPAMNHRMWRHPATQANIATLQGRGVGIVGPNDGPLAEGESGPGRMAEPLELVAVLAGRG